MSQKPYKILIIEDEKDLRVTLADILEISGYEVHTASDGQKGLKAIIEINPNLVLCDINMPIMNGFEVLIALKKQLENKPLPKFIFLSARVQTKDSEYGLELGADAFITKPFDTSDLLKSIKKCLLES